jgi:thiosulfate/3-mercaptopyruvate sulfurtransferase
MKFSSLITTQQLAHHLADKNWAIIDCRFDLARPEWGFEDYQKAHIPGAVYAHLDHDLAGPLTQETGRHPLPSMQAFQQSLSNWGIDRSSRVAVYDTVGGAFAVRLWWMLHYVGHSQVTVLDGGFQKWVSEKLPIATGIETRPFNNYELPKKVNEDMIATAADVEKVRLDPEYCLIDARTAVRFRGENEPIDPVAGHIPGAVNRFHGENLNNDNTMKEPIQLGKEFKQLLDKKSPEKAIVYCGSGVTSCHHLLAMDIAGLKGARLYVGSWSEWIRDPQRPIASGG